MHTPYYGSNVTHLGTVSRGAVNQVYGGNNFNSYLPAMEDAYGGWWSERFARRAARSEKRAARICAKKPDSRRCARKLSRAEKRHAKHAKKMGIPYTPPGGAEEEMFPTDDGTYAAGMGAPGAPNPLLIVGGLVVVLGTVLFVTRKKG